VPINLEKYVDLPVIKLEEIENSGGFNNFGVDVFAFVAKYLIKIINMRENFDMFVFIAFHGFFFNWLAGYSKFKNPFYSHNIK
jgi:hypothetical protein